MPDINQLRKNMLYALDNHIIPALKHNISPPLAYARFPLQLPQGITVTPLSGTDFSSQDSSHRNWPVTKAWPQYYLIAKECPMLEFVYEGIAEERTAILSEENIERGVDPINGSTLFALRLPSPAGIYFPSGLPHLDGEKIFWESEHPERAYSRILQLRFFSTCVLAHLCCTQSGKHTPSHVLQIHDKAMVLTAHLFAEELSVFQRENQDCAAAFLLTLMQLLRKNVTAHKVQLLNTAWPNLACENMRASHISPRSQELCGNTVQYIQLHLQEKLTLKRIAEASQVTPRHLSWTFQQVLGISVMRYVTHQRIEAAKRLLSERNEHVQDVAQLAGFEHFTTFCSIFRRETNMSPSEYRRYSRQQWLSLKAKP